MLRRLGTRMVAVLERPVTAVATPVTATAATAASFATASWRSRPDRLLGLASFTRAPAQPAMIAASPAEWIQP